MRIRLAVIGLLLVVLSPLVINGLSSSAATLTPTNIVVSASPNPVIVEDDYLTLWATVSPATATGEVVFTDGSAPLCTATLLDGMAQCIASDIGTSLVIGTNQITGTYTGDASDATSSGETGLTAQTLNDVPVSFTLSPGVVIQGTPVTFAVHWDFSPPDPGPAFDVAFYVGSQLLCATKETCTTTAAPVGIDTITALLVDPTTLVPVAGDAPLSPQTLGVVAAPVSTPAPPPTPILTPTPPPVVTSPSPTASHGYWLVGSDGGIFTFGDAQFYGSTGSIHLQRPVVSITPTANDGGYWLVASDGGIFSFGDAGFYGSIPGLGLAPAGSGLPHSLNAPIVGMVPSSDGNGYFMVGADGGVFTFGDARFEGSCPAIGGCPGGAAVAVMPDSTGNGYWVVTAGGFVTPFGDATSPGEPGPLSEPVVSAVRSYDGNGYYLLYPNGVVYAYGDAVDYGTAYGEIGGFNPATTVFTTSDGGGYWIVSANGSVITEGDALYEGGANSLHLNGSIIAGTGW